MMMMILIILNLLIISYELEVRLNDLNKERIKIGFTINKNQTKATFDFNTRKTIIRLIKFWNKIKNTNISTDLE